MSVEETEVFEGSGNVFADIGLPDAENMLLKSSIVIELRRLIEERELSQSAAAALLGLSPPQLSQLLRGHLKIYSIERLMHMLTAFEQDVEIVTRRRANAKGVGRVIFRPT